MCVGRARACVRAVHERARCQAGGGADVQGGFCLVEWIGAVCAGVRVCARVCVCVAHKEALLLQLPQHGRARSR